MAISADSLRQRIAREFLPQEGDDHLRDAFGGLEHDVADETVAHHHVHRALVDVVAFDVAVEIEAARAQQFRGLLHRCRCP